MSRPLDGLKVLDFTHVLAGPFATRIMGDMGADVVKVNSAVRAVGANTPEHPYYLMWNRNKRALDLDMSQEADRETCRRLCEQADVVIDNFSVGVMDRWGVGYDETSKANPGVIYVQMSGMGEGGPWSKFVTYAPTIHALCGLTYLTSVPGREDIGIGASYNDHMAGMHGAVAVLSALQHRARTGEGQHVDVSQFEVGVNFLGPSVMDFFANGVAAEPMANDLPYDRAAPHGCYPCIPKGEGTVGENWIAIACLTDHQWQSLVTLMGSPGWAVTEAYATVEGRLAGQSELEASLSGWTSGQDAYELMANCQAVGVPAGVVQDGEDLAERDPQLALSGFLHKIDDIHPTLGQTYADRLPIRFARTPCETYNRSRVVGEDTDAVLKDWLGDA